MNKVVSERRGNIFDADLEINDSHDGMSNSGASQTSNRVKHHNNKGRSADKFGKNTV